MISRVAFEKPARVVRDLRAVAHGEPFRVAVALSVLLHVVLFAVVGLEPMDVGAERRITLHLVEDSGEPPAPVAAAAPAPPAVASAAPAREPARPGPVAAPAPVVAPIPEAPATAAAAAAEPAAAAPLPAATQPPAPPAWPAQPQPVAPAPLQEPAAAVPQPAGGEDAVVAGGPADPATESASDGPVAAREAGGGAPAPGAFPASAAAGALPAAEGGAGGAADASGTGVAGAGTARATAGAAAGPGSAGAAGGQGAPSPGDIAAVRRRIDAHKIYPRTAVRNGWEGKVLVEMRLEGDGSLAAVRLLQGSGYTVLDEATITAVRRASPFPPVARILTVPVEYRLIP